MSFDEKIDVVGAGLVGSLLSISLAKLGFRVQLLERRPDMRSVKIGSGRSINLAVSVRGLNALKEVGLESTILEKAIPMGGRLIHSPEGNLHLQRYGKDDSECIHSISRAELNKTLMTAAEATGRVKIQFEKRVDGLEGLSRVIGTDGSASAIRKAMGVRTTEERLDYGYKELEIRPGPGGAFAMEKNALHIWPRGRYMLIALPNFEGSFTCTLFLPFNGTPGFDGLNTPADVENLFRQDFPDVMPLIPELTDQFFENPTGQMTTVRCFPWNKEGKALLMGDAAHAIVPFFGQGMNCGFEDVSVFSKMLETASDWDRLFAEFSILRKPNADAIADMAIENFTEMRDKVTDPAFILKKEVEKILQEAFPGKYASRYSLVSFSQVPYKEAFERGVENDRLLKQLCDGIADAKNVDLEKARSLVTSLRGTK